MRTRALGILTLGAVWIVGLGQSIAEMIVFREIMYHPPAGQPEYLVVENLTATPLDMAGWQFTDGIRFQFPAFSTNAPLASFFKAHERLVVSSENESATRAACAIPNAVRVFGPWTGKLRNDGERVTLRDKNGVIVCTVKYGSRGHWPREANGAGHSLVLKDPNRRVDDWRNWTASQQVGTRSTASVISLEKWDAVERVPTGQWATAPLQTSVVINEIMFDPPAPLTEDGAFVELFNRGTNTVDVSGWRFEEGIHFTFPAGITIAPHSFLVVARNAAYAREVYPGISVAGDFEGKLKHHGELLRLVDAAGHLVNEVDFQSGGDWPDQARGGGSSLELIHPWMDNRLPSAWRASDESRKAPWRTYAGTNVYRELNPLGQPSDYRELHLQLVGRGHVALKNLALLRSGTNCLVNGTRVSTDGTGARGWLCQGTHWASFVTNGEFHIVSDGRGDDRANRVEIDVPALEPNVTYELRFDARWISGKPRLIAQSWDRSLAHSFLFDLPKHLGTPGTVNSCFWAADLGGSDSMSAGGRAQESGRDAFHRVPISSPEARDGVKARDGVESVPTDLIPVGTRSTASPLLALKSGTEWNPSLPISWNPTLPALETNPGSAPPQVDWLQHSPAVPRPEQRVKVIARVWSAAPLRSVELLYRADTAEGNPPWLSQPMFDDGVHGGDGVAGDSFYTAELNVGRTNGQVVQFFVRATARNGGTATLPRQAEERPALFAVDGRVLPRELRTMRIVVSARDLSATADGNTARHGFRFPRLANHNFNATVIANEEEIIYNAGVRNSGSPLTRAGELRKPKLKLPEDHAFRGHTKLVYDDDAAAGRAYHNRMTRYLLYLLGHPVNESEFVRLVINAGPALLREETEPVANEFLNRNFARGSHGELYRIDEDWTFLDDWQSVMKDADWIYQGEDAAPYRNSWMKRTRETEDDYSRLIEFFRAMSQTNGGARQPWECADSSALSFYARGRAVHGDKSPETKAVTSHRTPKSDTRRAAPVDIEQLLDVRAVLKLVAVRGYLGDEDTFTMQVGRNAFFYRRPDNGKFQFLHWDGDEGFLTRQPFYGGRLKRWIEQPQNHRLFNYYLLELVRLCSQSPARVKAWLEVEHQAVGETVFQATYLNFFKVREPDVFQAMAGKDRIGFEAQCRSGVSGSSTDGEWKLSGRAPYGVFQVLIVGHAEASIEWSSDVEWNASGLRLRPEETDLRIKGVNEAGDVVAACQVATSGLVTRHSP